MFPHCKRRDPFADGANGNQHRKAAIHIRARERSGMAAPRDSGHIAAPQRTDAKGRIAVNGDENDKGCLVVLRSKN